MILNKIIGKKPCLFHVFFLNKRTERQLDWGKISNTYKEWEHYILPYRKGSISDCTEITDIFVCFLLNVVMLSRGGDKTQCLSEWYCVTCQSQRACGA